MTRKNNQQEHHTEILQTALGKLELTREKYLKIIELRVEQARRMTGMNSLLDPALDDLETVDRAMAQVVKALRDELENL